MLQIWAFDPGLTTGFAHIVYHLGEIVAWNVAQLDHEQVGDWMAATISLAPHDADENIIVCESFTMTMKKSQSPWSLEAIGLLRFASLKTGYPLVMQTPAAAKSLIRDEVIKSAGMYIPGKDHQRDAQRHALYYLMTNRKVLTECLREPDG